MLKLLFAVGAVATADPDAVGTTDQDAVRAWKVTYAAADPVAARDFSVEYLGAREIPQPHKGGNGSCALIKWVTFDQSGIDYQFHFVDSFEARVGNFTLAEWSRYMQLLNGNISGIPREKYNQYMDNHVGLYVEDMKPYVKRLEEGGVPYFTRKQGVHDGGCDVFVQLPNNGIIVELACATAGCCPSDFNPVAWDLCKPAFAAEDARHVRAPSLHRALSGETHLSAPPPSPSMVPWKMTYASTDPAAAANFVVDVLGASHIPHAKSLSDHCGTIRWVQFPPSSGGWQMHFVHNPHKPEGNMSLKMLEQYFSTLHGDLRKANGTAGNAYYDAFMDNHAGVLVDDVAPYVARLKNLGVPFFTRGPDPQDVFVEIPGGIVFELAHKGPPKTPLGLTPWDLCQH